MKIPLHLLFLLAHAHSYLYRRQISPHISRSSIYVQRSNFNSLIERCKQTGIYTPAVKAAISWLNEDNLTSSGLTSVIQIFGLASMVDDAVSSLEKATQKGLKLNHYHFNACINACKNHKRYDLAMQIFDKMKSDNIVPTVQTLSIIISICSATGEWNKAYELFSSVPAGNRDAKLYSSILLACDKAGCVDLSLQLWQEMKARGGEVCSSQSFNSVISALCKNGQLVEAKELFESEANTLADKIVVFTICDHLTKAGKRVEADEIRLKFGKTRGLSNRASTQDDIRKVSFNELLTDAKRTGDFKKATEIAEYWLKHQKSLSKGGVTACFNIFGHAGSVDKLCFMLRLLKEKHVDLNTMQANALMSCLNRCSFPDLAISIFLKMEGESFNSKLKLDVSHTGNLRRHKKSQKSKQNIMDILSSLIDEQNIHVHRDAFSFGIFFSSLEKCGDTKSLVDVFQRLPSPGSDTCNSSEESSKIARNLVLYNSVLSAVCKNDWKLALKIYDNLLLEDCIDADKVSRMLIVSCLMKAKQFKLAADIENGIYFPGDVLEESIIIPSRTFSSLLSPQTIVELDRLRKNELEGIANTGLFDVAELDDGGWEEEVVKFADINLEDGKNLIVTEHDAVDDFDEDEIVSKSIILKDESWVSELNKGVAGRVANLEEKLLYQPNAKIDGTLKALQYVGRFDAAKGILNKLESEGIVLKIDHYNSAIRACGDVGNWQAAVSLFQEMYKISMPRNEETYSLLQDILWEYCDDEISKNEILEHARLDNFNFSV